MPTLRTADQLAKLYGNVNINQGAIKKSFEDSANASAAGANRDYTRNLADTQSGYLDALRRGNAAALQSGAAKGMQGAQELSTMLGLSQQSVAGASKLASDQYASLVKANQDAMAYADQNKLALGELSAKLYGEDVTHSGNLMQDARAKAQLAESRRQYDAGLAFDQKKLASSDYQFSRGLMQDQLKLAEDRRQFDAKLAQDGSQFAKQLEAQQKAGDATIAQWERLFNKSPGQPFTPAERAMILKMTRGDYNDLQKLNPREIFDVMNTGQPTTAPAGSKPGWWGLYGG